MQDGMTLLKPQIHNVGAYPESSDERLVARIGGGNRLAMEALYARHHLNIYRFVLRLVNDRPTAEDLTSDVFLEVWKQAARFEGRSQVSTWILSIAHNKAMSALRRPTNESIDGESATKIPDSADNAEVILERQSEITVLR